MKNGPFNFNTCFFKVIFLLLINNKNYCYILIKTIRRKKEELNLLYTIYFFI